MTLTKLKTRDKNKGVARRITRRTEKIITTRNLNKRFGLKNLFLILILTDTCVTQWPNTLHNAESGSQSNKNLRTKNVLVVMIQGEKDVAFFENYSTQQMNVPRPIGRLWRETIPSDNRQLACVGRAFFLARRLFPNGNRRRNYEPWKDG